MVKIKQVQIGSEVVIKFEDGFKGIYKIVNSYEADILANKISAESPFGKAVLGQKAKRQIDYFNPMGQPISCKIIKIK